jgi:hypothetical protein
VIVQGGGAPATPAAPAPAGGAVSKPKGLSRHAGRLWDELAPHAEREGTLTPAKAFEFAELCELAAELVLTRKAYQKEKAFTELKLKLGREYRGQIQRLEVKFRAFNLAPTGKEVATPDEKPKSTLQRLRERRGLHAV